MTYMFIFYLFIIFFKYILLETVTFDEICL